jgi:hypothetical protein
MMLPQLIGDVSETAEANGIVTHRRSLPIASTKGAAIGNGTELFVDLSSISEPGPMQWVVEGLIPENFITILYGNSGLGKSYLCLHLALSVLLGRPFMNRLVRQGNVLWLDFEQNEEEASRRLWKCSRGMGLTTPPKGFLYYKPTRPLGSPELSDEILAGLNGKDVSLVVIDSLSIGASGSDVSEHRDVVRLLKSIESWGTVIAIDHITKAAASGNQSQASIFGSAFKRAIARSTLILKPAGGTGILSLCQDKNNYGVHSDAIYVSIQFEEHPFSTSITQMNESDPRLAGAGEHMGAMERVNFELTQAYAESGGPVALNTLINRIGRSESTVRSNLSRLGSRVIKHGNNTYSPALVNNEVFGKEEDKIDDSKKSEFKTKQPGVTVQNTATIL